MAFFFEKIKLPYRSINMNIVGPQVRALREAQNLTQEAFAAKCHLIGWSISRGTLAKIESQVRRVTDEEITFLADALKVDVNCLFKSTK